MNCVSSNRLHSVLQSINATALFTSGDVS